MFHKYLAVASFLTCTSLLHAQAKYTAARTGDLQVGVEFVGGKSDYGQNLRGPGAYASFDFTRHFGAEFDIHQGNTQAQKIYERTYELGARYYRDYGRLKPFIRGSYGRGVFNYPNGVANLAYNIFAGSAGADYRLTRYLNVRAAYEYQNWLGFPVNGLDPQLITIGVAYHFPSALGRGRHY